MPEKPVTNGGPEIQVAVLSETGKRPENQDWMSWSRVPWGECYIVADGMGGYKGGALAARMTVEGLENHLKEQSGDRPFEQALQEAVSKTNEEVYRASQSGNPETDHMGSTLAVALISRNQLLVGHVGDSRIYLVRDGRLKLLTTDHTSVQRMVDAGMLTEEQARVHPDAHILSRAMGSKAEVEIEIGKPIPLESGDGILLCSDGLSGYVRDKQIEKAVRGASDVQRIPKRLVDLALESGSDDNITVQFIRYGKPGKKGQRHTAVQGEAGQRIQQNRSRWVAASVVVLAGVGVAIGVGPVMDRLNRRPQIIADAKPQPVSPAAPANTPPASVSVSQSPATKKGNTGSGDVGSPHNTIAPQKSAAVPHGSTTSAVAAKTTGSPPASPATSGTPGPAASTDGTPAAAPAAATPAAAGTSDATAPAVGNAAPPVAVLIFRRSASDSEIDLVKEIERNYHPSPTILKPSSTTDLDKTALQHCFIFYPNESLKQDANVLNKELDKIKATADYCPSHTWQIGPYKSRTLLQHYVEDQAEQLHLSAPQHLLITFPKTLEKKNE